MYGKVGECTKKIVLHKSWYQVVVRRIAITIHLDVQIVQANYQLLDVGTLSLNQKVTMK